MNKKFIKTEILNQNKSLKAQASENAVIENNQFSDILETNCEYQMC